MAKKAQLRKVKGECSCEICGDSFFPGEKAWAMPAGRQAGRNILTWYCERHNPNPNNLWGQNAVQFPRLIAELWGIGLTQKQREFLKKQMELTGRDIDELFERADKEWQKIKAKNCPPRFPIRPDNGGAA